MVQLKEACLFLAQRMEEVHCQIALQVQRYRHLERKGVCECKQDFTNMTLR